MSESKEEKHDVILPDAIVSIRISTGFYQRLQAALNFITKDKTAEEIQQGYEQIKTRNVKDTWVLHMETLFIFLKDFQVKAKEDGFVKKMTESETQAYLKEKFPDVEKEVMHQEAIKKTKEETKERANNVSLDELEQHDIEDKEVKPKS